MSVPTPGTYYKGSDVKIARYPDEAVWLAFNGYRKVAGGPDINGNTASHGDKSGTVTLESGIDYHEMNLTGDVTLIPKGSGEIAVFLTGEGDVLFQSEGPEWMTDPIAAPGTVILIRSFSGWRAYGLGITPPPPQVTPAGVTFVDGTNEVLEVNSSEVGVIYSIDSNPITFDGVDNVGFPEGAVLVVATAAPGYELATGATTQWPHTFGPLDALPLDFNEVADLASWYKSDTGVTITGSGVSQWNDIAALGLNNHMTQTTDANRPGTITLNGKTWIQFNATTDDLRKTSMASPANARDNTLAFVIRAEHAEGGGVAGLPGGVIGGVGFDASGVTDPPVHVRWPNSATHIVVEDVAAQDARLFVMATIPTADPGAVELWVGNLDSGPLQKVTSSSLSVAAIVHLFVGGSGARFSVAEIGIWSTVKGDAEAASLFAGAKANWGTP